MRKAITIDIDDTDRQALMAIVTDRNSPQKHVWQPEMKHRGRKPSYTRTQFDIVRTMLDQHHGVSTIAKMTNLSRQTIYRIKQDPAAAEAVLTTWRP
jgi:DNA invertase Pin-like site-specific DNA recombinase